MKTSILRKLWAEIVEGLAAAKRHYSLDDKHAIQIEIILSGFDSDQMSAHMTLHERMPADSGDPEEWDCVDLDSLPARLLGRVAEYKVLVERWNANELEEFPPSTTANFLAAQEARQRDRRHLRRRRMYR